MSSQASIEPNAMNVNGVDPLPLFRKMAVNR